MIYEVVLGQRAKFDLGEAYRWYEQQRSGLGDELEEVIFEVFERLSHYPMAHQVRYEDYRVAYTDRFDYGIHYRVSQQKVNITAIVHTKQDPEKWNKRD